MNTKSSKKPNILAIIPARGGSKGVPKKNIKLLNGKPLLAYTIHSAKQSKHIDKLILSSEDDKIISISKDLGIEVPFKRPKHLALDNSSSIEVVQHAIAFFEAQKKYFDAVLLLQPTTPFRTKGFIDEAIEKFINEKCDALVSVLPVPNEYNPHWVFELKENNFLEISTGDKKTIKQRQDLPRAFHRDGSVYITKTEFIKQGSFFGEKLSFIESNPKNYVNIDTIEDWGKAEKLIND